jgi:hypothetical protein
MLPHSGKWLEKLNLAGEIKRLYFLAVFNDVRIPELDRNSTRTVTNISD